MSDKDQFTFEEEDDFPETKDNNQEDPGLKFDFGDDDDEIESSSTTGDDMSSFDLGDEEFPETDLSSAFSDGEVEAENPVPDVVEEPAPKKGMKIFGKKADKPKKEKKAKKEKPAKEKKPPKAKKPKKEKGGGGGSSSRLVLILLLLVVVAGAGAYYFMGLGESTPSVPTAPVPAQKAVKAVAVPPKPAPAKVAAPAPKPAPVPAKAPAPKPAQEQPAQATAKAPVPPKPAPAPVVAPAKPAQAAAKAPVPPKPEPTKAAAPAPKPAPAPAQATTKAPVPPKSATAKTTAKAPAPEKPAPTAIVKQPAPVASEPAPVPVKQTSGGDFALDAGSYLLESNRDTLIAKIKKLGYEPLVTPVDATINMTRLRLGTFSKADIKEALDFARSIEPGAYSAPAGDNFVIYAGTFLQSANIEKLKKRFLEEGIKVYAEPVEVVRTLSRIRFGTFATKDDAAAALASVAKDGVKAVVVKSK